MTPAARAQIIATIAQLQAILDADCDCPETDTTTVRETWDRYVKTLPDERWKLSVVSMMKRMMARFGDVPISKLRPTHIEDYRDDPEIRAHYSVATRRLQIKRLRACLNWACDTGRIAANPIARMKLERAQPKRETEISHEGEAAVLENMPDEWMRAFFLVAIDSAMRRGEIRLTEWTDIDWEARKIVIPAGRTKTRRERIGRLTTRAADALRALPRVPGSPYVFADPKTGQPHHEQRIWRLWRRAADAAKLRAAPGDGAVHFHDARASTASRIVRLGGTMPAVQQILGHASLQTTSAYVRVQSKDVDVAHALLEAHLLIAAAEKRKGPHRARGEQVVSPKSTAASGQS